MWEALQEVAREQGLSVNELVTLVDRKRDHSTLTAAIRVFLLDHYRRAVRRAEAAGGQPPDVGTNERSEP